jgi:hypothetical protein
MHETFQRLFGKQAGTTDYTERQVRSLGLSKVLNFVFPGLYLKLGLGYSAEGRKGRTAKPSAF